MSKKILNIGVLGAARILPDALLKPADKLENVRVYAIAARDPSKANKIAEKHGIPVVKKNYDEIISDPQIDAVYIPLPNGLHAEWSIKAMQSGKHVLCEKPIANNKEEAQKIRATSEKTGMLCVEAFHYVYHPLMSRIKAIMDSEVLGEISHYEAVFCYPFIPTKDIRFQYDLGGGATMDMGCYAINILRRLSRQEPTVKNAKATVLKGKQQIDRMMTAELIFPSGATGTIKCAMRALLLPSIKLNIIGELGEMKVINPFLPHLYHRIKVKTEKKNWTEKVKSETNQTSYFYQLQNFTHTILKEELKSITGLEDAVKNMAVIDQVYLKAGLKERGHSLKN